MILNIRVLRFIFAYIFGLGTPGLSKFEKEYTLKHLLYEWSQKGHMFGICCLQALPGDPISYWQNPIRGIVGGFDYRVKSYEDAIILECWDIWDFEVRNQTLRLGFIPVPETFLVQFNAGHSFETRWEVEVPEGASCPVCFDN